MARITRPGVQTAAFEMNPDPRPERVRFSRAKYLALVRELLAASPLCECGCGRRSESVHHLLAGNSKDDVPAALVCLNGSGTTGCHGALTSKMRVWDDQRKVYIEPRDVAVGIRRNLRPNALDYILARKGRDGLDRLYPPA